MSGEGWILSGGLCTLLRDYLLARRLVPLAIGLGRGCSIVWGRGVVLAS